MFVYLWLFPLQNFAVIWRRHHYHRRAANFDLCSALVTIEQWGFFSMPHLLWQKHPFKMVISEDSRHSHLLLWFSSETVTICFYDLRLSRLGFEHSFFRLQGQCSNPLRDCRGWIQMYEQTRKFKVIISTIFKINLSIKNLFNKISLQLNDIHKHMSWSLHFTWQNLLHKHRVQTS